MSGRISCRSLAAYSSASSASASPPPTWVSSKSATASRTSSTTACAPSLPGAASGTASMRRDAVAGAGDARGVDAVDLLHRGEDLLGLVAGEDLDRVAGAGRERLAQPLGGRDGLGLLEELVGRVEPGGDGRGAGGQDRQAGDRGRRRRCAAGGRRRRRPGATRRGSRPGRRRRRAARAARTPTGRTAPAPPAARRGRTSRRSPRRRHTRGPGRGWSGSPRAAG